MNNVSNRRRKILQLQPQALQTSIQLKNVFRLISKYFVSDSICQLCKQSGCNFDHCKNSSLLNGWKKLKASFCKRKFYASMKSQNKCNRWFRLRLRICVIALNCFPVINTSIVWNKIIARRWCCFISIRLQMFDIVNLYN